MKNPIGRVLRRLTLATTLLLVAGALVATAANAGTVLILSTTVTGGASSREAQAAVAAGHTVEIATPAQWALKTAAQFDAYDALILGDPTCGGPGTAPYIGAAEANRMIWSPVIDGNIVVIGTDEVFHHTQGGSQLTTSAVTFAARRGRQDRPDGLAQLLLPRHRPTHAHPRARPVRTALENSRASAASTTAGIRRDASRAHRPDRRVALELVVLGARGRRSALSRATSCRSRSRGTSAGSGSVTFPDGSFGIPYILARGEGLRFISNIELTPRATDRGPGRYDPHRDGSGQVQRRPRRRERP